MPIAQSLPTLGILGWEDSANQHLLGSLAAPGTFPFPVIYEHVKGACYETIIENPDSLVLDNMIAAARSMEHVGIRAITTSCGFNAIVQDELSDAVNIPVFTSSLLQVPLIYRMLSASQSIGILTVDSRHLTSQHLINAGIPADIPVQVVGIENTAAQSNICHCRDPLGIDIEGFRRDVVNLACQLVENNPQTGAIVLEMTILHVFSEDIRQATGLPLFDIVQFAKYIHASVA